eukprot:m.51747 g.51747  ORF g.51747 m.51747 type:complete len:510 (-) comp21493_c2_seq1:64-1593(-)
MAEFDIVDGWGSESLHDYEPASSEEIGLAEGDFICVETQCENGWWIGTNRRTKKRGLFPGSYVDLRGPMKIKVAKSKKVAAAAAPVEQNPFESPEDFFKDMDKAIDRAAAKTQEVAQDEWQWGKIDREKAVQVLQGKAQGTFLVRASTTEANAFSISVVQDNQVRHLKILNVKGGFAINNKDKPQPSLAALIKQKQGEKLSSKLQGTQRMKETQLLVKPLPNPSSKSTTSTTPKTKKPAAQSQIKRTTTTTTPAVAKAGGNNVYARQRGGTANVAATSLITAPTDSKYKSRALKEKIKGDPIKPVTSSNADPFAVSTSNASVDPFAVSAPVTADPFAVSTAPTTVDPFAVSSAPVVVDPFAVSSAPAPDPFATTTPIKPPTPEPVVEPEPEVAEEEEEEEEEEEVEEKPAGSGPVFLDVLNFCYNKCQVDDGGRIDGSQLKPLLMMSKLPNDILGEVWSLVDAEKAGSVDYVQLGYLLGLMGQAQRGETLDIGSLGAESVPPQLEGLAL